jgi:hypothetical protein
MEALVGDRSLRRGGHRRRHHAKSVSVRASLFKARSSIRREILATHPCYREERR